MTDTNRYGPTAARKQKKPGRESRPQSTTIDIHSHVGVPAAAAIALPTPPAPTTNTRIAVSRARLRRCCPRRAWRPGR